MQSHEHLIRIPEELEKTHTRLTKANAKLDETYARLAQRYEERSEEYADIKDGIDDLDAIYSEKKEERDFWISEFYFLSLLGTAPDKYNRLIERSSSILDEILQKKEYGFDILTKKMQIIAKSHLFEAMKYPELNNMILSEQIRLKDLNQEKLRNNITNCFNIVELRTMCFDLGVPYDTLSGEEKETKVIELIEYLDRRIHIDKLICYLYREKSESDWSTIYKTTQYQNSYKEDEEPHYLLAKIADADANHLDSYFHANQCVAKHPDHLEARKLRLNAAQFLYSNNDFDQEELIDTIIDDRAKLITASDFSEDRLWQPELKSLIEKAL